MNHENNRRRCEPSSWLLAKQRVKYYWPIPVSSSTNWTEGLLPSFTTKPCGIYVDHYISHVTTIGSLRILAICRPNYRARLRLPPHGCMGRSSPIKRAKFLESWQPFVLRKLKMLFSLHGSLLLMLLDFSMLNATSELKYIDRSRSSSLRAAEEFYTVKTTPQQNR